MSCSDLLLQVKTHWGGRPMVEVTIERCGWELFSKSTDVAGELDEELKMEADPFPEYPLDFSVHSVEKELLAAQERPKWLGFEPQERIREMGNELFRKKEYEQALAKYKKAPWAPSSLPKALFWDAKALAIE